MLMRGYEEAVLELTFLKMVIIPQRIGPVEDNPRIA